MNERHNSSLDTQRLMLRPVSPDDALALLDVFSDNEVMAFSSGVMSTEQEVGAWIERHLEQCEASGHPVFVVIDKSSSQPIGYVGLFDYPDLNGQPETELGYRLARRAWGKGLATEATEAVVTYAQQQLGVNRLVSMIDPANLASISVRENSECL